MTGVSKLRPPRRYGVGAALGAVLLLGGGMPDAARAQVPANEQWYTVRTPHFFVHFTREEESVGRRVATAAERAYANLARELVPPRGPIDVVVTDAADGSNGLAGIFPRNHIVVQAQPPVDQTSLESYTDWIALVMQHEVTHIFHLDRSRGWWRAAQFVFGRNPVFFPNDYTPSWLTEGLAVYFESHYDLGGRLQGSYQYSVARAAALERQPPRLSDLSLVTSRYPYGQAAYVYGAFIVDQMSRTHGPGSIRRLIETMSAEPIPFLLDFSAKQALGETFTHAWQRWRDSVLRDASERGPEVAASTAGWTMLPGGGRYLINPRWRTDSTLFYFADNGRETPGLYTVSLHGDVRRLARLTALEAGAAGPGGRLVFAQGEFLDRFHFRNDLYERYPDGTVRRLTTGERLNDPDVRADGAILVVQTLPGTTRLVRVSRGHDTNGADGTVSPLTRGTADTQWTAPRWSPDGAAIAAIRLARGASEVVVLDTLGRVLQTFGYGDAVTRSPSWSGDGRTIFFTSDRTGVPQVYSARFGVAREATVPTVAQLTTSVTGLFGLDAQRVPANPALVSTMLRLDGFHVVTLHPGAGHTLPAADTDAASLYTSIAGAAPPFTPITPDTTPATTYSPWRTLRPAYWSPLFSSGADFGTRLGAVTSSEDVVGLHSYVAQALWNTQTHRVDALATYRYNRFVNPIIDLSADQSWDYTSVYDNSSGVTLGRLDRRIQTYSLQTTFVRQRVFTASALTLGAEYETRMYRTAPDTLLSGLLSFYQHGHQYPGLLASVAFSNTQRPTLSISPEDGIGVVLTGRQRWASGVGNSAAPSAVLVTTAYKSLPFPGFAHHVIALRAAGGITNNRSPGEYSAGGVSGTALEIVPGLSIGNEPQTFPVRGFAAGTEDGIRAAAASLEYRAPLSLPSRGFGLFPLFVDRTSLTLFADAGRAYCPRDLQPAGTSVSGPACGTTDIDNPTLTSVGAELNIDTALQFDVPYRFRFGVAHPMQGRTRFQAGQLSAYVTLGAAF